jgi:hypothetical protein
LASPESVKQQPQVLQRLLAAIEKIRGFAESVGGSEEFVYPPYAKALQDLLGSHGADNVSFVKEVSRRYDPKRFFQRMVPGSFKIDRVE